MLSWRNPDASDRELTMDDYLHLGIFEALAAIATAAARRSPCTPGLLPGRHAAGHRRGTALARGGIDRGEGCRR
jgi:hypothetical protein